MVLGRISEERDDASVSKKGILAVSAMTRGHQQALDSMDKEGNRIRLPIEHSSPISNFFGKGHHRGGRGMVSLVTNS